MKYMLLLYSDETLEGSVLLRSSLRKSRTVELAKVFAEFGSVTEALEARKQLKHTEPLRPSRAATTVLVREGKRTTTDGPFAETKEQLGATT